MKQLENEAKANEGDLRRKFFSAQEKNYRGLGISMLVDNEDLNVKKEREMAV